MSILIQLYDEDEYIAAVLDRVLPALLPPNMRHDLIAVDDGPQKPRLLSPHGFPLSVVFYTWFASCFLAIGLPRHRTPTDLLVVFTTLAGLAIWREISATATRLAVSNSGLERVCAE